ncbi:MAG: hypothetical protein RKP46_18535, partial [Candidatus Accumulibacter sp.]|nr:hypothetical protein [Accumulibacter sp.]
MFLPRKSPGRIEAIGIGATLAVAAGAEIPPARRTAAQRAGRRAATAAVWRALDDGADAAWNPDERPAPKASVWRAAPPLHLYNPSEPLAGRWRTWALADGGEFAPPPPVRFGSRHHLQEARAVLRVARTLTNQEAMFDGRRRFCCGSAGSASSTPTRDASSAGSMRTG